MFVCKIIFGQREKECEFLSPPNIFHPRAQFHEILWIKEDTEQSSNNNLFSDSQKEKEMTMSVLPVAYEYILWDCQNVMLFMLFYFPFGLQQDPD